MHNVGFNTTNGKIAIVGLRTNQRIELQFVPEIQEDITANWNESRTLGNFLFLDFGGTNRKVQIKTAFTAQTTGFKDVIQRSRELCKKMYLSRESHEPEGVLVVCGELFQNIPHKITNMTANYSLLRSDTMLPKICNLSITFVEIPNRPRYAEDI